MIDLKNICLAAILMAAASLTACSSSDDIIEQPVENTTAPKVYTMTIQASKPTGDDATTRGLYWGDGETKKVLKVNWNGKEKVRVVQDGKVIGTLSAAMNNGENENKTTLTGTVKDFNINSGVAFYLLAHEDGTMDYTGQKGNIMDDNGTGNIEENYDYASYELEGKYTKEAFTIDGNTIVPKDGTYIPFASQQAIVRFELLNSSGDNLFTTQLIVTDNQSGKLVQSYNPLTGTKTHGNITITPSGTSTSNVYYAALNFDAASDIQLRAFDSNGDLYTYDKKNVTFTKGKYYRVTVKMQPCITKMLSQITPDDTYIVGWHVAQGTVGEAYAYDSEKISFPADKTYAIIAYVGNVPGYFNNFLAMAMHDSNKDGSEGGEFMSLSEALTAIGSYATAHPIVIGSTTYNTASNTAYDEVADMADNTASASNTSNSTRKGWRIPSVTDWRYIFYGLCGEPSPTNPAGITHGVDYGSSALLTKFNDEQEADLEGMGWYCTSSAVSGANDYRWMIHLSGTPKFQKMSMTSSCLRPVFAY